MISQMSKYAATVDQHHHLSVGAILTDAAGCFVLLSEAAGCLGMMTGTLDDNETLEQCLHRELSEETGATCEIDRYAGSSHVEVVDHRGRWEKTVVWFYCSLTSEPTVGVVRVKSLSDVTCRDPGRWPSHIF